MMHLGIDIGGTQTKLAVLSVEEDGKVEVLSRLAEDTRVKELANNDFSVLKELAEKACLEARTTFDALDCCGVALPGPVDREEGVVAIAPNIGWFKPLAAADLIKKELRLPVAIENDAACAGIAEARLGAGEPGEKILLITLGTGVGASYVVDGAPFAGFGRFGGELGHAPLVHGGIPCSCGIDGCFQQYGSATALVRQATQAATAHPESKLAEIAQAHDGAIVPADVFCAARAGDSTASNVLEKFTLYLAEGIGGMINSLRPDRIILGGGLSLAGSEFAFSLAIELGKHVYANDVLPLPTVSLAACGPYAGAIGAALTATPKAPKPQ